MASTFISKFKSGISPQVQENITFDQYIENIKTGVWQNPIIDFRTGKIEKKQLPGVTPSGTFSPKRAATNLEVHSGIIGIDIDAKEMFEGQSADSIKETLSKDPYTYVCHKSVSGEGIVVFIKIDSAKHLESFNGIEKYYLENYKVIIDPTCKDVSRFRFVSIDPELFQNKNSKTFKEYIKQPKQKEQDYKIIFTNSDIDAVLNEIYTKRIDLVNDYYNWFRIGGALQNHFGNEGRDIFHEISKLNHKYNAKEVDRLFDILSKRNPSKIADINTFLDICTWKGIRVTTPQTEDNIRTAKSRIRQVGTNGGYKSTEDAIASAKQELELAGNLHPEFDSIAKAVAELPHEKLKPSSDSIIDEIETYLNAFNIKRNDISQKLEIKEEPITDTNINSLYKEAIKQLGDKCTRDKFMTVLFSDAIPTHNPFKEFYQQHAHMHPSGNFEKLCSAIQYRHTFVDENGIEQEVTTRYLEIFLKKWLLGIIASSLGTYSLAVLVLAGGQRTGKTKFFRELLPKQLYKHYYAESKLDEGKDAEILMTQKLLIVDDEFGGKSKRDAKRFKDLSSKQTFTVRKPYGKASEDLLRYAVLAGTTNEEEIINDPTGNRRIIPINVTAINHEILATIDRTELFMELYHEHIANPEKFILTPEEIAKLNKVTEQNKEVSADEDLIIKLLQPGKETDTFFTTTQIIDYIQNEYKNIRLLPPNKFGTILRKLGFIQKTKKINKLPTKGYLIKFNPLS